ncbi:MAG: TonB-dependent receptor [Prolixibacteraceae bacterium]|nr:TonB-dependent receptor [Prolixibacteraceae bacterium]
MKKKSIYTFLLCREVKKALLIMKLTTILILAGLMQVSASVYSQATKFSLKADEKPIVDVLKDIEETSKFRFFYIREQVDVERQVSINTKEATVEEILDDIFSGEGISYEVLDDNLIILKPEINTLKLNSASKLDTELQQKTVTGRVLDVNNQPLPGVTVVIKNTTQGTITGADGEYSIPNVSEDATLVFSFIGMIREEIPVAGMTEINVVLVSDYIGLEEVVAIGYGVQKKSNITGSIASVKSSDLENRTSTDAAQALQGKAAGVQIVNSSGAPGKSASIQIRGFSSNSKTEPLIIVDGLKVTSLDYLDPENIESVEILKDGASAAIYGIEAGNGVILVTTKSGTGEGSFFYNMQYTTQKIANLPDLMNAQQYMEYIVESGAVSMEEFQYDGVTDTYWADQMFETGIMQRHTAGFEGGNERGNLYVSLTWLDNNGIITSDKDIYKRLTGQINAEYKVKEWLNIGVTTSIEKSETNTVSEGSRPNISVLGSILVYDPITPWTYTPGQEPDRIKTWLSQGYNLPSDENGNIYGASIFSGNTLIWHPAVMRDRSDNLNKSFNLRGTGYLNITPIEGLTVTSRLGYRAGYNQTSTYNYKLFINATANQSMTINGRSSNNLYYQWENFATYVLDIGQNNLSAMAGMSFQHSESDFVYGTADQLTIDVPNFRYLSNAVNSTGMSMQGQPMESANMSYYGRLGWSYDNKYNLQASFRADAYDTSKLDKSNRWGYFPSVSGGWTISDESFMDNIKSKIDMSLLRLRASYGINGNVNALGSYQYSTTLNTAISYGYDFGSGGGQLTGSYPSSVLPNPEIKWETYRQINFGLDARFLRDRLTLVMDWYNKDTHDLLTSTAAPANTGASNVFVNAGIVNNKGLEIMLGWRDAIGDFTYDISGNISYLKNEVTEGTSKDRVDGASIHTSGTVTYFEEGYPLWYLRTYVIESIDPETGAAIYEDIKPDGILNTDDRRMTGSAIPDYTYGMTINLGYKNFDLIVYGAGVQGNEKLFGLNRGDYPQANTILEFYENRWTPTNNENPKYPKPNYFDQQYKVSDAMVFDASFFKIKQIQLGYNVPKSILSKAKIAGLRAYVSLDDWFTFSKYPGLDPETNSMDTNINSLALDYGNYPISKKVVLGVNISF